MSKIVILGHTGFLGSCLYQNFLEDQQYEVYGFSSAQVDLSLPEEASKLTKIFDSKTTVIMAATALVKNKDFLSFTTDISMFTNLAQIVLKSKIRHLIYISTPAIYGRRSDLVITESSQSNPDDFYSLAKFIGELIFKRICANYNIALTILRPGILYGRDDIRSPFFRFITNVRLGKEIDIHGDDTTRLIWIHNDDLFRVIHLIVKGLKLGDYNVASEGNGISLLDLSEMIFKLCCMRTGIKFIPNPKIPFSLKFDLSKFKAGFPGFAFIKLEDGLKDYLDIKEDANENKGGSSKKY